LRELPILFNGRSVRSIIVDKTKTETRRVIKPQPDFIEQPIWKYAAEKEDGHGGIGWYCAEEEYPDEGSVYYGDPYGPPGTILWVRESAIVLAITYGDDDRPTQLKIKYMADGSVGVVEYPSRLRGNPRVGHYLAYGCYREAHRIRLKVVEKFPQQLHDMKDEDAEAEGYPGWECAAHVSGQDVGSIDRETPLEEYISVWNQINPKFPFKSNSWTWVIKFEMAGLAIFPKEW